MGIIVTSTVVREPSQARRPAHALERRTITVPLSADEHGRLASEARHPGVWTLAQYIRSLAGLQFRNTSLPGSAERDDEEDDAWERLQRLGLDPQGHFEPEG